MWETNGYHRDITGQKPESQEQAKDYIENWYNKIIWSQAKRLETTHWQNSKHEIQKIYT